MIFLRREAEKIVRELFQPEGAAAAAGSVRVVADLRTDGDHYVLEVELPGVEPADVQVYAFGDALVIEGQKRPRLSPDIRPAYERAERDWGSFRRVFDLPGPADLSKTVASLRAGLLCLRVPRIVDRRGRARPIKVELAPDEGAG
ncbi:MAG TPA: Hsp20/alpha crystallin family protein [Polyangia bacterium]|nr:Hsp20/alpha crystallin family protein [Polyangia bacterium]